MEPTVLGLIVTAASGLSAALVGAVVGARRGVKSAEVRADLEQGKLIEALTARVALLEKTNGEQALTIAELNKTVAAQNTTIAQLQHDLADERRITARLVSPPGGS